MAGAEQALTPESKSAPGRAVLEYHRPSPRRPARAWAVRVVGLLPFLVVLSAIFHETIYGDPPNNLREFKAYHYSIAVSLIVLARWVIWVGYEVHRGQARWVALLIAVAWCAFVSWIGIEWLRDLNGGHPADYYRSQWKQQWT